MFGRVLLTSFLEGRVGIRTLLSELASRVLGRETFAVPLPDGAGYVRLRCRTTDRVVYEKVIVQGDYEFAPGLEPKTIVDAGANVGLSAIYFARRFPAARVVAVEPEEANFRLLCDNIRAFPSIEPVRAALWSSDGQIALTDPGIGPWGFRVSTSSEGRPAVRSVTMDTLMREMGIEHVDLLKVDIEGAEREVFAAADSWIARVGTIVAELHDRYVPGSSRAFFQATSQFDWEWTRGENVFVSRADVFPSGAPPNAWRVL